jgi:hypothetical protein
MPPEAVEDENHRPDRNRGVGHVECRPVPARRVQIQKVDHVSEAQAVDDVANRAAEDQGEPGAEHATLRRANEKHRNDDRGAERKRNEQRRLPPRRVGQKAERSAPVEHEDEVEEAGELEPLAGREAREHEPLRKLVDDHDGRRNGKPRYNPRHRAAFHPVRAN